MQRDSDEDAAVIIYEENRQNPPKTENLKSTRSERAIEIKESNECFSPKETILRRLPSGYIGICNDI